ncbi:peroxisomal carnitine O-octanoyltransferase-like [Babylonia areolata]|uniref:peroxisomal carnitine O-octanoyltransferase-like n=1 Tax=Babylonia areolata TaxID=304850 RepID=UPI003FD1A043
MASSIDAQVISDDEKTFQYQDDIESLPVPSLEHTLSKYLDSVKPLVTDEEFREVEFLCQQFAIGEGKILHEKLLARAQKTRNWLEKWWEDVAYMEGRLPNPLMNMAGPGPYVYDVWKPQPGTMIPRSALMLYFMVEFWQLIRKEKIRPHMDGKGRPMCMNQFRKLFSTCNIPGLQQDHLVHYFKTESEGPAPSHVVVFCKGHAFRLECVDEAGNTLTAPEFQSQLQKICDKARALPPAPGLGFFTTMERTQWAKIRSRLLACHPDNYRSLQCIEMAMVAIGLDDYSPRDVDDLAINALFGDPSNKWFDKSGNFISYQNGMFASNCDHSPMDGMMLVFCTYYIHRKVLECDGHWKGPEGVRKLPEPQQLQFHLDPFLLNSLEEAKMEYRKLSSRVEVKITPFTTFGKKYLKTRSVHPDTCFQLAVQLAYFRMYNKHAPTYETATTRRFYHARTETVRSCTPEACRWCQAMGKNIVSDGERLRLFMSAVDKHNKWMEECTQVQGCDRHFFGLAMVAREEGLPIPSLFQNPAFFKSGGGGNYILSTSCIGYTTVLGGVCPMCPHGYGIFYCIQDDKIMFFVSSWTEDEDTNSKTFSAEVSRALVDIQQLLDTAKVSTARL